VIGTDAIRDFDMAILLITPPMTQLNTPYPATPYLTGFLKKEGLACDQVDLSLELARRIFSSSGLERIRKVVEKKRGNYAIRGFFLRNFSQYSKTIESVIHFLQGRDSTLAYRIVEGSFLPRGQAFKNAEQLDYDEDGLSWAFGSLGVQDRAKYFASLYLDDLVSVIREGVDERFVFARYAEKLAASQPSFLPIKRALKAKPSVIDEFIDELSIEVIKKYEPELIGITLPFPGNVYAAFRIAKQIKNIRPEVKIVAGGGFVNTELRFLSEPDVFDYFDFVCPDANEAGFLALIKSQLGKHSFEKVPDILFRRKGRVQRTSAKALSVSLSNHPGPSYQGLALENYFSLFEMLNPMFRLWSDGRWNKLTIARGCYWRKCSFCDTCLPYISDYDPCRADVLVQKIERLIEETGNSGFHFVDEAAPPAFIRAFALKLLERRTVITWWANIRFEKSFTPELAALMAKSGCVAVTGGLEVPLNRLLGLMQKGVTVEQVARVTRGFSDAGIMVHAYLIYGAPTQTVKETVDALEVVRQLFANNCVQSAYWHRFSVTAHSKVFQRPADYGVRIRKSKATKVFSVNDIAFKALSGATSGENDRLVSGLNAALYNYMSGIGLEFEPSFWFKKYGKMKVPESDMPRDYIARALRL